MSRLETMMKGYVNLKYINPELYSISDITDFLFKRKESIVANELWLCLYSFRRKIDSYIEEIIQNWILTNNSNGIVYSHGSIVKWKGSEIFKYTLTEFASWKRHLNKYYGIDNSQVYVRLVFDKMKPTSFFEKREKFTKNVCKRLGSHFHCLEKDYTVNCYLGLVSSSSSSSKEFPRYEIRIHPSKEFPDSLDKSIEKVSDFYFSQKRLELKLTSDDKTGILYRFYRNEENQIPREFLESIIMKLECICNTDEEVMEEIIYNGVKLTIDDMSDSLYVVVSDYIRLINNNNFKEFMKLVKVSLPNDVEIMAKMQDSRNCQPDQSSLPKNILPL